MKIYIRAAGNISPQETFERPLPTAEIVEYQTNRLSCLEPDYKSFIDAKLIRRMSRIVKMGVAAASACLKEAGTEQPGAIITGTAYGCMEDTGIFLTKLIGQKEEMLSPTAFIQSTHNTVGAQIALLLKCHNYNNTFVHRGFSFESALLDAIMLMEENEAKDVLVGGIDEITDISHVILSRFGLYRQNPVSNLDLFRFPSKGTIAGEGAGFFLLRQEVSPDNYAELTALATFYKPAGIQEIQNQLLAFLQQEAVDIADIDLVITGKNGDAKGDEIYNQLGQTVFNNKLLVNYKHLCGEYPTSTAFALWLAATIAKTGTLPFALAGAETVSRSFRKILIYNHYQSIHHSLLLISAC